MSEINKSKKNIEKNKDTEKNKPDFYKIIAYGLGAVIVLVCAIIIITIVVKENRAEPVQELVSIDFESETSEVVSDDADDDSEVVSNTETDDEIEESVEEPATSESESAGTEETPETNTETENEEVSEEDIETDSESSLDNQVILSDSASIAANWQTIPAGTVIDKANIDFNNLSQYFVAYEIPEDVYNYINGKSYQENPYVALSDLRYVKLLHYNFNHELQVGELIVAADLQGDYLGIFAELFAAEYEIQSMYLPDKYWTGDPTSTDSASIDVNNSSCFMYRPATGSSKLSKHSYGRAIDINPQQNPYVSYSSGSPVWSHENANDYIDRTTGLPHVITENDVCYQIFTKYGFTWGGSWTNIKDYQHFQK